MNKINIYRALVLLFVTLQVCAVCPASAQFDKGPTDGPESSGGSGTGECSPEAIDPQIEECLIDPKKYLEDSFLRYAEDKKTTKSKLAKLFNTVAKHSPQIAQHLSQELAIEVAPGKIDLSKADKNRNNQQSTAALLDARDGLAKLCEDAIRLVTGCPAVPANPTVPGPSSTPATNPASPTTSPGSPPTNPNPGNPGLPPVVPGGPGTNPGPGNPQGPANPGVNPPVIPTEVVTIPPTGACNNNCKDPLSETCTDLLGKICEAVVTCPNNPKCDRLLAQCDDSDSPIRRNGRGCQLIYAQAKACERACKPKPTATATVVPVTEPSPSVAPNPSVPPNPSPSVSPEPTAISTAVASGTCPAGTMPAVVRRSIGKAAPALVATCITAEAS